MVPDLPPLWPAHHRSGRHRGRERAALVAERMTGEIHRMADSSIGLERSIDPITYSPPTSSPSIASLVQQATIRQSMGQDTETEELLRQALGIADRTLGPGDPELMLLLTDLTRLHLRRSSYAAAEPLLLRLLELKRGKGDDHPEVATVLANLANV